MNVQHVLSNAVLAHKNGHLDKAEKLYLSILALNPKHVDASHNLGLVYAKKSNLNEAALLLKTALEGCKSKVQYWLSYVECIIALGMLADAASTLAEAPPQILNGRPHAHLLNLLGNAHKSEGSLKEAERHYRKSIEAFPHLAASHYNLGNLYRARGEKREALKAYEKATEIDVNFFDAHTNLGVLFKEAGDLQSAEKSLRKALEIDNKSALVHNNLGNVLKEAGSIQQAEAHYREASIIKPNWAVAHYNLANVQKALHRLDEALESYESALRVDPEFGLARAGAGKVLLKKGMHEDAIQLLRASEGMIVFSKDASFRIENGCLQ